MRYLDIDVRAHLPQGKDGKDENEANAWLMTSWCVTMICNTAPSRIPACRTGLRICLPPAYEPYVVGSASVHLRANPNGARSAVMPGFQWAGSITKSTRTCP